ELENSGVVRAAELRSALDDRLQHRLELRRRRADDSQDLARAGLLRQRLRELAVAYPQLFDQTHVLDRDHGLVGESLEELDLPFRESAGLGPGGGDGADGA